MSDLKELDSVAKMMFILEVEEKFKIEFSIEELSSDDYELFIKFIYDKVN